MLLPSRDRSCAAEIEVPEGLFSLPSTVVLCFWMQARSAGLLELSIRPSRLSAAQEGKGGIAAQADMSALKPGQAITGWALQPPLKFSVSG